MINSSIGFRCSTAIVFALLVTSDARSAMDSTKVDTVKSRIISAMGTSRLRTIPYNASASQWRMTDARSLFQVLGDLPGVFMQPLGEPGQIVAYSWLGLRDGILIDAVPHHDPFTRRPNLALVPLEYAEGIEVLDGPHSALLGGRWNLVSLQRFNPKPLTAIRFFQEPFETILTDAFFTQNIMRSTNLLFGFQRHTTDGRFANSGLDAWQLRSRIRTNLSDVINFSGWWRYERTTNGLNGGVDRANSPSIFNEVTALVHEETQYQILERSDVGLTALGRFLGDTTSLTRLTLSQTSFEREYRIFPGFAQSLDLQQFSRLKELRVAFAQSFDSPFALVFIHASAERVAIDSTAVFRTGSVTRSTVGLTVEQPMFGVFFPSLGVATHRSGSIQKQSTSIGIRIVGPAGLELTASGERSPRFLSPTESSRIDSLFFNTSLPPAGTVQSTRMALSVSWDSSSRVSVGVYRTGLTDIPFVFNTKNTSDFGALNLIPVTMAWSGITASARVNVWKLHLESSLTTARSSAPDSVRLVLPGFWGSAELAFEDRLFQNELGLRLAVRTRFADRFRGTAPDPATALDVVNQDVVLGRAATLDVMAALQIGDAFVSLGWENVTNVPYLRTAVYPMPGRTFKLGVRWEFRD